VHIAFLGDLSQDVNVVQGVAQHSRGGGVFYGGIAAHRLGVRTTVYTKCEPGHEARFVELVEAGVPVRYLPAVSSTSVRNDYPTDDPDDRTSTFLTRATPVTVHDLDRVEADVLHVNPLWLDMVPPELLLRAQGRFRLLGADAQGFLRRVADDGSSTFADWPDKERYLSALDVLKVDLNEARTITGLDEPEPAARALHSLGARTVLLTHAGGVLSFDGDQVCTAPFGPYTIEGRTGRGDTCTAAFLVGLDRTDLAGATRLAAEVTTAKMQYPGPYRG